jgi:4-amino-4-deoxy-L-arabinose transferase-like glycosyltransferase
VSASRPWLAVVLALFCLPLFVSLGRTDVGPDEAIYSFGVDRILESGDWLTPKSSPHDDAAFLEKPPLKFWIVAAPIRLGLLPRDELGLRFWDALFGAVAFLYVFAIGSRLAGPVCGAVAVLILFVHGPLLFEHGLRSNNMEASLVLCYCGGIFHYLGWASSADDRRRRFHAMAAGLYFVLGFMTKCVAAIFLPLVIAAATLLFRAPRAKLRREWRLWTRVGVLVLALVAPWFVYANVRFGTYFWHVILDEHVYTRFTSYLNPAHVQPWSFYFTEMYHWFADSGSELLVAVGLLLLVVQTVRRRWLEGAVVVLWFALPLVLISFGTSKLYHDTYPFLPPLALAAGYLVALTLMLAPVPLGRGLQALSDGVGARAPSVRSVFRRPAVRAMLLTIGAAAIGVAAISEVYGPIRLAVGRSVFFKSSGVIRPIIVIALFGAFAGASRRVSHVVVALLLLTTLPLHAYRESLSRLTLEQHPMRTATDCLARVQSQMAGVAPGLYVDLPDSVISHPLYYYFRRIRPWTRAQSPEPAAIGRQLDDPAEWRPMLVWDSTYQDFVNARAPAGSARPLSPPMVALPDVVLLLPGPYAVCAVVTPDRAKAP